MPLETRKLNQPINTSIYKETTILRKKKKHRDKSDLGPNFVAPDGGWGWIVCIAAGLSNLCLFLPQHQYGLIYRQRMEKSGFDAKEISTIVNAEFAISSLVGLVNGAMFRRFTFRQVGLVGSLLAFVGIFCTTFCENFLQYIVCFASIYGIGLGLCRQANSLALNTYFKTKRRKATGFSWTITGLGFVVFPQLTILMFSLYVVQGTISIYSAIMLHAFMCSLTLQPVLWHSPKTKKVPMIAPQETHGDNENLKCSYCRNQEEDKTLEISEKNDWRPSNNYKNSDNGKESHKLLKRREEAFPNAQSKCDIYSKSGNDIHLHCTCTEEKLLLEKTPGNLPKTTSETEEVEEITPQRKRPSLMQKIIEFFDLDLLKDFTFVNLALGMAIMMFGDMNFTVLTPFILNSFGYTDKQISIGMSCLAGVDIGVRFLSPFVLENVKLSNSVLFAIGIIIVSIGRWIVTITSSYNVILASFILLGFGKGFRIIFSPLIIPSYVPLKRLPAASGLQMIFSSITSFTLGPLLGMMTDSFGYAVTIHCINALSFLMLLFWLMEYLIRRRLSKHSITSSNL
ncbi:monocarboxylate transporter 9-like [Musca domestica]|uniref:Monocarboxylate transporter 9-like n=1 Tax=Musca domestica TaxID=7370 RepID=A0ABM3VJ31_MUSDO|nr:monocarboxylate transporter 9-like [Musca domestica]